MAELLGWMGAAGVDFESTKGANPSNDANQMGFYFEPNFGKPIVTIGDYTECSTTDGFKLCEPYARQKPGRLADHQTAIFSLYLRYTGFEFNAFTYATSY